MSFHTESSARKSQLVVLSVFIVFALLSLFGLKIALITCLYFEGMTLICFIICFVLVSKTRWLLDFQYNVLILTNTANHNQYRLGDLTVSDFHFKQTSVQIKANRCDLKLTNLPFGLYDVNHYEELKAYIISAY